MARMAHALLLSLVALPIVLLVGVDRMPMQMYWYSEEAAASSELGSATSTSDLEARQRSPQTSRPGARQ